MIRDRKSSDSCVSIDRAQAAALLQEARNADGSVVNDAIDWAFPSFPKARVREFLKSIS